MKPGRLSSAPLLLLLLWGCPKGGGKNGGGPDGTGEGLNRPDVKLIVGGVDPSFADPRVELPVEVFGGGFEAGATVSFSGATARAVRFNDESSIAVTTPALEPGAYDVTVTNPDGVKATLRKGLTIRDAPLTRCEGATLPFDFDSASLSGPVRSQLEAIATCIRASGQHAIVEGHSDERGTTEYNLALGQRRADSVTRYLAGLGVNPSWLRPVSYGEERPAVDGRDEAAWAANRRAVLVLEDG